MVLGCAVVLLVAASVFHSGYCITNGDIRLNYYGTSSYRGILQVYMEGRWGTVCSKKFNFAAAAAACRQLGYRNAAAEPQSIGDLEMEGVEEDGPMWLENVQCPNLAIGCTNAKYAEQCNEIYASYGERHLLRCSYTIGEEARRERDNVQKNDDDNNDNNKQQNEDEEDEEDEPCDRDDQVFLTCDTETSNTEEKAFLGSVQLQATGPNDTSSGGLVQVYQNEKWYPICWSSFSKIAADSACQQLGYTNSMAYHIVYNESITQMLKVDFSCQSSSQPCFSNCINHDKTRFSTNYTDKECWYNGKNGGKFALALMINCTFEPPLSQTRPAGTRFMCERTESEETNDDDDDDADETDDNSDDDVPDADEQSDDSDEEKPATASQIVVVAAITVGLLVLLSTAVVGTVIIGLCCITPTCSLYRWRMKNYQSVS